MKTLKITGALIIALSFIFATSCDKYNQGQVNVAITGDYSDLTPNSVTLFGWCNQKEEKGLSVLYGIEYSNTDLTTAARTIQAESKDSDNKYSCKLSDLSYGTKYYYRAYVLFNGLRTYGEVKTFETQNFPELVDLGLSVKWRGWNLGATKPEEYGGYYQWAGLEDVSSTSIYLDFDNCPYHTGSSFETGWTKYVPSDKSSYWSGSGSPDNKTVLDLEDDVAHVMLGGKWRMPTKAEFEELYNNCTSEWTTLNGVYGRMFTSKKNGNSIFLPAAGCRYYDSLYDVGSHGHYRSSSLKTGDPSYAYTLYFSSYGLTPSYVGRYDGQSVRPVSE